MKNTGGIRLLHKGNLMLVMFGTLSYIYLGLSTKKHLKKLSIFSLRYVNCKKHHKDGLKRLHTS